VYVRLLKCLSGGHHRHTVEVYGKGVMNEGNVRKWYRFFKEGGKNVRNEERRGHPSLVTDNLKEKVKSRILENRRYKISELQELFSVQVRRSDQETKNVAQDWLKGLAASFFEGCVRKLLHLYGDYVEK